MPPGFAASSSSIMGEVRRPRTNILVEAVGHIAAVDVDAVSARKTVVRQHPRRNPPGRIMAKASRHIVYRASAIEIVGESG